MPTLKPQLVRNENGEPLGVFISMAEYEDLVDYLDDIADASEIERRVNSGNAISHEAAIHILEADAEVPD